MKRYLALFLILVLFLSGCGKQSQYTPDPELNYTMRLEIKSLQLDVGGVATIGYTYTGPYTLLWSSSDEAIFTVDQSGYVQAKAAGTAYITLTDGIKFSQCVVVVVDPATENG